MASAAGAPTVVRRPRRGRPRRRRRGPPERSSRRPSACRSCRRRSFRRPTRTRTGPRSRRRSPLEGVAQPGGDRQRRRQTHRARTGDDQYRQPRENCVADWRPRREPPGREDDRERQDERDEDRREPVGQPLDARRRTLDLPHERRDAIERALGTLARLEDERAIGDDRAADDPLPGRFVTGRDSPVRTDSSTAAVPRRPFRRRGSARRV